MFSPKNLLILAVSLFLTARASCVKEPVKEPVSHPAAVPVVASVTDVKIDTTLLEQWQAGAVVSKEMVNAFGMERCFAAEPIPDTVWARMQGKTFKKNPYIGRNDLRHVRVLHWDYDNQIHIGEMICNRIIADRVVEIFRKLFDARYPIERMVLPDVYDADDEAQMRDNNTSCFCYRVVPGSSKLSKHARGLAIDINPRYNPYFKLGANGPREIMPANGTEYCNRSKSFRYKIDHNDLAFKLFTERGFRWGGDWRTCKDYQHFDLIGK